MYESLIIMMTINASLINQGSTTVSITSSSEISFTPIQPEPLLFPSFESQPTSISSFPSCYEHREWIWTLATNLFLASSIQFGLEFSSGRFFCLSSEINCTLLCKISFVLTLNSKRRIAQISLFVSFSNHF